MAKVSIVIPVYNVQKYLRECLDSVKNQTLSDIEVICVDDGSTDSSGAILDEYAKEDNRFQVIHKKNEGYGKAMNVGMAAATGKYTAIVESDDMVVPHMYETLYALMEEKELDVTKADYYQFYKDMDGGYVEEYVNLSNDPIGVQWYEKKFYLHQYEEAMLFQKFTWSGMYRTEFLRENQIVHNETPGASYQDNGFWFQTMVKASSIYFVKQAFYKYRIDNLESSMFSKAKVFAVCNEYDFIDGILTQMGEEGKPYFKWSTFIRVKDCIGNITRVADESKEILAQKLKEDFLAAASIGRVESSLYSNWFKEKIFKIIASPKEYVLEEMNRLAKIRNVVDPYNIVILYGAGLLGRRAYQILREGRLNIKVKYFAVTEKKDNPDQMLGVRVLPIDELKEYREEALIIISVGQKFEKEVENNLKEAGFKNYIFYKDLK